MGMGREMLLLPIKLKAFRSALKFSCGVRIWLQSCVNKGYFNSLVGWGGRWLLLKRLVKLQQNISFSILSIFPPLQREKKKALKWKHVLKMINHINHLESSNSPPSLRLSHHSVGEKIDTFTVCQNNSCPVVIKAFYNRV